MIRKIEIERFSLVAAKQFDDVVGAINAMIGHPDMADFWRSTHRTRSVSELETTIRNALGSGGLMLFVTFDHGSIIQKVRAGSEGLDCTPEVRRRNLRQVPFAGKLLPRRGRWLQS